MGYIAIILASVIGGLNPLLLKLNLVVLSPFALMFIRFSIALICVTLWLFATKKKIKLKNLLPLTAVSSLVGFALLFIIIGLSKTTVTSTQSILSLTPVLIAIFSSYLLHETPTKNQLLGVLLGFVGISLIISGPLTNTGGNIYVFLATVCNTLYIIISRKYKDIIPPFMFTVGTIIASTLIFGVALLVTTILGYPSMLGNLTATHISSLLFLGTIGTFGMFYFLLYGISKVNALFASLGQYIQLPVSIFLGILLLDEQLSSNFVLGTILVVLGSIFATKPIEAKSVVSLEVLTGEGGGI